MSRAGDILDKFFDKNFHQKALLYSEFFDYWNHINTEQAVAHSKVRDFDKGIIYIQVDHPGWIQILQMSQAKFLTAYRKKFPDLNVRGLAFSVQNNRPTQETPKSSISSQVPSSEEDEKGKNEETLTEYSSLGDLYEKITDPHLRETFERLQKAVSDKNRPR